MLFCLLFQVQGGMRYEQHEANNPNSRARHPSAPVAVMGLGAPYGSGDSKSTNEINQEKNTTHFHSDCIFGENKNLAYITNNKGICDGCHETIQQAAQRFGHE